MKAFRFLQLDVFTDELFGGNQLAVLPDARGIPEDLMLRIARAGSARLLAAELAGVKVPALDGESE